MKQYRKSKQAAEKVAAKSRAKAQKQLKKDIARNRSRAKWVGILYLLGIIAMAATFVVSVVMGDKIDVITGGFSKVSTDLKAFVISVLYALAALVAVVNVFKALGKLGWLHKKKATMEYGFNRNAYAMNDLSGLFTGTATFVFINYLLISILTGPAADYAENTWGILDILMGDMMMLIFVAVAAVIGLLADVWGGKVKYYDIEEGHINVEAHLVGRFAGFLRKLIRIAAFAVVLYAIDFKWLNGQIAPILATESKMPDFGDMAVLLPLVAFVCVLPLIKRAFRATDYSLDGAGGDKGYALFAFIILAVGGVLCAMVGLEVKNEDVTVVNSLFIAIAGAVAFIFELILRRSFKFSEEVEAEKQAKKQAKEDKKAEKKQAKEDKKAEKKAAKKEKKSSKKAEKKEAKKEKKEGSEAPNWDENEFTFETLMRQGNITIINTAQPANKK